MVRSSFPALLSSASARDRSSEELGFPIVVLADSAEVEKSSSSSSPGKKRLTAELFCPMGLNPGLDLDPDGIRGRASSGELTGAVEVIGAGSGNDSAVVVAAAKASGGGMDGTRVPGA